MGIIPSKTRWERKQGKKNKRLMFTGSRSSTSLDRSASGASNGRRHGKSHGQKIAFSRKFPFMKSRERLNNLPDDEDENGINNGDPRYEANYYLLLTAILVLMGSGGVSKYKNVLFS